MTDTGAVRLLNRFTSAGKAAWEWISARAWTRAGAMAAVLATTPRRRALTAARRVTIHLSGSLLLSIAVALMLWNDFGPGPLDVFIVGIGHQTGIPLAVALWATVGSLLAVAWLMGRKPGLGSLATPIIVGPAIQGFLEVFSRFDAPAALPLKIVVQLVAITVLGVGAGAIIASGLGAGMGELLTKAASDRSGQPEPLVRLGFEMTWLAGGLLLGGPFGFGTLIVALMIGPSIARGYRLVDRALSNVNEVTRRQIQAHAAPATVPPPARIPIAA